MGLDRINSCLQVCYSWLWPVGRRNTRLQVCYAWLQVEEITSSGLLCMVIGSRNHVLGINAFRSALHDGI
jgi:hypothetical protein